MEHERLTDELREQAALYVFDALDRAEKKPFEAHLREGCGPCNQEVRSLREATSELGFRAVATPPPDLRRRLMERIQPLPAGVSATRTGEGKWITSPYPGISIKRLYQHPVTKEVTQLVRFAPGAKLPPHHHSADEQCLVVEGDIRMGNTVFRAGDFTWASADSDHRVISSEGGCVLLIVASPHDEYSGFDSV